MAPLSTADALRLSEIADERALQRLLSAAAARRDRAFGRTVTFSPKVFLPLTNLCRNRCDYCSFRRSPGDPGAYTMERGEVLTALSRAASRHCGEALVCIGDKPEAAFGRYRATLAERGFADTVDFIAWASEQALAAGLLPHTNAGVLTRADMARLRCSNVSLGLMLENISPRLCEKGMPHHRAPDKRPERRMAMLREAGELRIPFTTGILIGIGETRRERVESLLAIRDVHRTFGHIQEVIVQNFAPRAGIAIGDRPGPDDRDMAHCVALARLILDDDVSVQAPPNLNPTRTALLLAAGINDFGGISPVTPDYINPQYAWPLVAQLHEACASQGFALEPRLPIYPRFVNPEFLDDQLLGHVKAAGRRLALAQYLDATAYAAAAPGGP